MKMLSRKGCIQHDYSLFLVHRGQLHLFPSDCVVPEQQGNAPQGAQTHQSIDDAAEEAAASAEKPCHKVELKQADEPPVDAADDVQSQCGFIQHNHTSLSSRRNCAF